MIIKSMGVLSVGKFSGAMGAILGLLVGGIFSLFSVLGAAFGMANGQSGAAGMLFGVGAVIIAPIFYGLFGFLYGIVAAFFYNIIASMIGGVEIELE